MEFLMISGGMTLFIAVFVVWAVIYEHNRSKQLKTE